MTLSVDQASATDTAKLSIYQPITVQDAYPTAEGAVQAQSDVRWDRTHEGKDLIEIRPVVKWGAAYHLQLSLAAPYRIGDAASSHSGDVIAAGFYQITEDSDLLPAMAVSASVHPFYGAQKGTEVLGGYFVTKSLTGSRDGTEIHLNVTFRHLVDGASDDRTDRTRVVIGISQPMGEDLTVLADFVRQDDRRLGESSNLFEAGLRRQIGEDNVVSLGIGFGTGDQSLQGRVLVGFQHVLSR